MAKIPSTRAPLEMKAPYFRLTDLLPALVFLLILCFSTTILATPDGLECCKKVDFEANGNRVTEGFYAVVDLAKAEIVVPKLGLPSTCEDKHHKHPLLSILAWREHYKTELRVNANFFDVRDIRPHIDPCSTAFGLGVSNGQVVSKPGKVHWSKESHDTDSLVFLAPEYVEAAGYAAMVARNELPEYEGKIQNAVSGLRLLRKGKPVEQPQAIYPDHYRQRTAVGLTEDKRRLIIVVVNPGSSGGGEQFEGGTTTEALAEYLSDLGATDALNLDGGGSSQLCYAAKFGELPEAVLQEGKQEYCSLPSDIVEGKPERQPRPVPIFLGIN